MLKAQIALTLRVVLLKEAQIALRLRVALLKKAQIALRLRVTITQESSDSFMITSKHYSRHDRGVDNYCNFYFLLFKLFSMGMTSIRIIHPAPFSIRHIRLN